ncbi:DUF7530 family protein [Halorussus halophilus]|uniref:DUF7530 family protein n=1 Tax=Halorussus halophilus TaxID=2650975 RepID=UPI001300E1FE|nr:hypothetical protein [Halorussus halophilus]
MSSDSVRTDPVATDPEYGETWVYESIVGAIPGVDLSDRSAVTVQFVLFEGLVLAFAALYDLWAAVPAGTAAVVVAAAGSYVMLALGAQIRQVEVPDTYRRLLFSSSIEVVLGVLGFVAFLTYVFAVDPHGGSPPLFRALFREVPPIPVIYLALLILWDLCYRIGTGWWASVTGLWRTYRFGGEFEEATRSRLLRIDLLTIGFALVQLLLVPFVWPREVLVLALLGHVVAVSVVSGTSVVWLRRG